MSACFPSDAPCKSLWVLSTGRCGTLGLAELLGMSPDVAAHHEPKPQPSLEHRLAAWRAVESATLRLGPERIARLKAAGNAQMVYAETSWTMTPFAYALERDLLDSRFLFLHREPKSWARSWMREEVFTRPAHPARVQEIAGNELAQLPHHQQCLKWWEMVNRFSMAFCRQSDRCLRVPCEQLWLPDMGLVEQVFDFIGARVPPKPDVLFWAKRKWNTRGRPLPEWDDGWDEYIPSDLVSELGY